MIANKNDHIEEYHTYKDGPIVFHLMGLFSTFPFPLRLLLHLTLTTLFTLSSAFGSFL